MSDNLTFDLPPHIQTVVHTIEELHARHDYETTALQRILNQATALVGRPSSIGTLTVFLLLWVFGNFSANIFGAFSWDPPPFAGLEFVVSVAALYTTILILTTQRHDDQLAYHRERLTLQLAILSEQKSARIIQLLEEMRRDSPHLIDRYDSEAHAMSSPSKPQSILGALDSAPDQATTPDDPTPLA